MLGFGAVGRKEWMILGDVEIHTRFCVPQESIMKEYYLHAMTMPNPIREKRIREEQARARALQLKREAAAKEASKWSRAFRGVMVRVG